MKRAATARAIHGLSPTEAASYWRVRHDKGDMDADDVQAFDAWLAGAPSHATAWTRAERTWALFDSPAGDPHLDAMRTAALDMDAASDRAPWRWAALAASLALVVALFAIALLPSWQRPEVQRPAWPRIAAVEPVLPAARVRTRTSFETAVGQRLRTTLADGTIVTLNTNTALEVAYSEARRVIRLQRGQALFEVAKNRHRPFVVEAGGREITALGTVFEVRLDPGGMHVLLAEGRVSIAHARPPGVELGPKRAGTIFLRPGQSFVARLGEIERVRPANIESALLWRSGLIDFNDVTLAEASAELNRYAARKLVIRDSRIAALHVSGVFRVGSPDRFADAVREVLPVSVREGPEELELVAAERSSVR